MACTRYLIMYSVYLVPGTVYDLSWGPTNSNDNQYLPDEYTFFLFNVLNEYK